MADLKLSTVSVQHKSTNDQTTALQWLNELPSLAAFDFEVASIYTAVQVNKFKDQAETATGDQLRILNQKIKANGLSHPLLSQVTHLSAAASEDSGFVIIIDNPTIRKSVLNWLVTTDVTQIWHNASFDFRHIHHATGKFPKNYEDTQQLAKSIVNHVNINKALTGLKLLMGHKYGEWAVSADMFNNEDMYDERLLKYAVIDACATYALWNFLQQQLDLRNKPQDEL